MKKRAAASWRINLFTLVMALMLCTGVFAVSLAEGTLTPPDRVSDDGNITLHKQAERIGPDEWEVTVSANVNATPVEAPPLEVVFVLDASGTMMWCTDEEMHKRAEIHANYICGEHVHLSSCYTITCTQAINPDHYTQNNAGYWIHNQTPGATPCRFIGSVWKSPACGNTHVHTNACCSCGTNACMVHNTSANQGSACTVNGIALQTRFDCAVDAIEKLSTGLENASNRYVVFSNRGASTEKGSLSELSSITPGG